MGSPKNKNGRHFITRVDYKRPSPRAYDKGWYLRISYTGKTIINKMFYDKTYGGNRKALQAAKEYRDEILLVFPENKEMGRYIHKNLSKRNNTGILGVCLVRRKSLFTKKYLYAYQATYYEEKYTPKIKQFSCLTIGPEEALRRAIEFRENGTVEIKKGMKKNKKAIIKACERLDAKKKT